MLDMGEGSTPYVAMDDPKWGRSSTAAARSATMAPASAPAQRERQPPSKSWTRCCCRCFYYCCGARESERRVIRLNDSKPTKRSFPHNRAVNTKYGLLLFVPKVLLEQFRFFFNLYFLLVALSQFFPPFEIGMRFTYIAPLVIVLAITMAKEAYDDVQRWRTDKVINEQVYTRLLPGGGIETVLAQELRVGWVIRVETDERIPADLVLLRTQDAAGAHLATASPTSGPDALAGWTHIQPYPHPRVHHISSPSYSLAGRRRGFRAHRSARRRDGLEAPPGGRLHAEANLQHRPRLCRRHRARRRALAGHLRLRGRAYAV